MPEHISPTKENALIHDLINAEFDLTMIRSHYGVSPQCLSRWVLEEINYRTLTGLCVITDMQTQLMMNRCRMNAAAKLHETVNVKDGGDKALQEMSRRACVDLLRIDLPRTELDPKLLTPAEAAEPADGLQALQQRIDLDARQSAQADAQAQPTGPHGATRPEAPDA